ncbi:hypothetical protein ABZZ80_47260, partial [Streptomyces sp. NPDC006356]
MTADSGAGRASPTETSLRALRALVPPEGSPPAGDLLVVVDAHPTMRVWQETLDTAFGELRGLGLFDRFDTVRLLGSDRDDAAGVRVRSWPAAGAGRNRMVLVVTDGLAAGWRSGSVLLGLRPRLSRGPAAIVHLLPQPLWFRSGLNDRHLQVSAPRPGRANDTYDWRLREVPLEIGDADSEA